MDFNALVIVWSACLSLLSLDRRIVSFFMVNAMPAEIARKIVAAEDED